MFAKIQNNSKYGANFNNFNNKSLKSTETIVKIFLQRNLKILTQRGRLRYKSSLGRIGYSE
jgi:hypothetical protein